MTKNQEVTAQQPGGIEITGTYLGPDPKLATFSLVQHMTGTGRVVVGTFPTSSLKDVR